MDLIRSVKEKIALRRFKNSLDLDACQGSPSFFILTAGRSGSTLLRKLLMERSKVHIPPESDDLIPMLFRMWRKSHSPVDMREEFVQTVFSMPAIKFWGIDENELRESMEHASGLKDIRDYISCLYNLHKEKYNSEANIIGDKTPYLALRTNWLTSAYPLAKYIHIVRDGRDVVTSSIKAIKRPVDYYVERWITVISNVRKLQKTGHEVLEIKYENLVSAPSETLRQVGRFLEEEVYDSRQRNVEKILGDTILPHHENINKPLTTKSIGKWSDMSAEFKKGISHKRFVDLLVDFGYESN